MTTKSRLRLGVIPLLWLTVIAVIFFAWLAGQNAVPGANDPIVSLAR